MKETEWDKTCAKVLVGANKYIAEMRALGIDPDTIPKSITRVKLHSMLRVFLMGSLAS